MQFTVHQFTPYPNGEQASCVKCARLKDDPMHEVILLFYDTDRSGSAFTIAAHSGCGDSLAPGHCPPGNFACSQCNHILMAVKARQTYVQFLQEG